MTDEARRLHYSPEHWRKMRDHQRVYVSQLKKKYEKLNYYDCAKRSRLLAVLKSAIARYKEIETNYFIMSGHLCFSNVGQKSIIIGGVNYGLMLEGLRRHMRKEIDDKADAMFRRIEFSYNMRRSCKMLGDVLIHLGNTWPTFSIKTGKRLAGHEIPIGNYEVALRKYKHKK
jgi:hypothetical protein